MTGSSIISHPASKADLRPVFRVPAAHWSCLQVELGERKVLGCGVGVVGALICVAINVVDSALTLEVDVSATNGAIIALLANPNSPATWSHVLDCHPVKELVCKGCLVQINFCSPIVRVAHLDCQSCSEFRGSVYLVVSVIPTGLASFFPHNLRKFYRSHRWVHHNVSCSL